MSIADQITRLQGVKADIIEAIKDKGVDVPGGVMLGDCPGLISAITGGDVSVSLANIMPTTGIKVVDDNGYIGGGFIGSFYLTTSTNDFAIKVSGADFSGAGLGSVTFVDNTTTIGGRVYKTINLGGKTWLAENLDFLFSGCGLGGSGTPRTPNAWYYDNDNNTYGIDGVRKCGLLYNWYAVKLLNDNRTDLIPGWHIPSGNEFDSLFSVVGGTSVAGTSLKSLDNVSTDGTWPTGWNGSDNYGFSVLPSGRYNGSFINVNANGYFWTSSEATSDIAYIRYFNRDSSVYSNGYNKYDGLSVRLVKDT